MKGCGLVPIGALRTPVTFQRLATVAIAGAGNEGGTAQEWQTLVSTRAQVVAASGREMYAGDRVEAHSMHRITCRYFAGLLERDRVLIEGIAYNIRRVVDWEMRKRWLIVDVERGVAP